LKSRGSIRNLDGALESAVGTDAANKAGMTNVETRVMNAENIELDSDSFDAVICRIALMLFPNPGKALNRMRRVVKPGGKVAVMVYAALERNPYHAIFQETVRRLGNIPWPAPGEPWMFALGAPGVLEGLYREAGFQNVSVHAAPIPRGFPSAAAAVGNMRKAAGDLKELMTQLNEADRERAWTEIAEQFKRFEGPNGFEIPGEVLIGVGTE
jgi:SAM-dependent methyltransferase